MSATAGRIGGGKASGSDMDARSGQAGVAEHVATSGPVEMTRMNRRSGRAAVSGVAEHVAASGIVEMTRMNRKSGRAAVSGVSEHVAASGTVETSRTNRRSGKATVSGDAATFADAGVFEGAEVPAKPEPPRASEGSGKAGKSANLKRLEARIRGAVGKAIADFRMIEDGDRVMACVSGGKDSHVMMHMLAALARSAPVKFEVVAVNLDQKQPGFPAGVLPAHFASLGIAFETIEQDTYSIVKRVLPENKTMCGLCSRLRRGVLYRHAAERGFTKIALGHHREDIVETLFMNMFHGGRLCAMPPKLRSDDGRHVVIRPLAYCAERDLDQFARAMRFPIIPCNLCGSQDGLERRRIKAMLAEWERESPRRTAQIFRAIRHVEPSHLADRELFDFETL